ncbi:hypothetical protein [Persicitalea sp.]|uniref:hypothetical protein n=1 Tax=Persicitalea sp. TaxID=3100273 RepID=UPI0035936623
MKKWYKVLFLFAALAITFQLLVEYLFKRDSPEELENILNSTQQNESVVGKIGGYRSYELSYNYWLRDEKSNYPFDITVFGAEAYISYKGVSQFNDEENTWSIVRLDTLIKKY